MIIIESFFTNLFWPFSAICWSDWPSHVINRLLNCTLELAAMLSVAVPLRFCTWLPSHRSVVGVTCLAIWAGAPNGGAV